jgi:hypothetical protein
MKSSIKRKKRKRGHHQDTNVYVILAITTTVQKYLKCYIYVVNITKGEKKVTGNSEEHQRPSAHT